MLAIGLAGIAGLAALFTDPDKIPDEFWQVATLSLFAISALAVVIASTNGISTYANHLQDVKNLSNAPTGANVEQLQKIRDQSGKSILSHAKAALAASWVGAGSLIAFAALMLFGAHAVGAEAAMNVARKIVSEQPGNPSPEMLDHFQTVGDDYLITYVTNPGQLKYMVRVDRRTNSILEITKP